MEEFQLSLLKHLSTISPSQLSQLSPQQINQLRELTQLTKLAQKQQSANLIRNNVQQQQQQQNNVSNQQQELLRLQAQQLQQAQQQQLNQMNQISLTPQQLVHQQLSQNINFSSSFPPTLVPPQNQANLYAYGYVQQPISANANGQVSLETKYKQLLAVIEEMSKDIKSLYSGSKTSAERFKRLIIQARLLVKECLSDVNTGNR